MQSSQANNKVLEKLRRVEDDKRVLEARLSAMNGLYYRRILAGCVYRCF